MKAPDKIYIRTGMSGLLYGSKEKSFDTDAEYIRKDALLEWLKERINDGDKEGLMTNQIANLAYRDVIDKINSL